MPTVLSVNGSVLARSTLGFSVALQALQAGVKRYLRLEMKPIP